MTPTVTIITAVLGCTAFWEFLKFLISEHKRKKFDIEVAVQDIQKDMVVLQSNQDKMQRSLANLSHEVGEDRAINSRVRILSFADDMYSGKEHSKDAFDQVLGDIDSYERYCTENPHFKNNQTAASCGLILDQYKECEKERTFLQYNKNN